jgi:Zn finger protein HypA/HybF involved in hydrogenase expression
MSPYYVRCEECGLVQLTWAQYNFQMSRAHWTWFCPHCHGEAYFVEE